VALDPGAPQETVVQAAVSLGEGGVSELLGLFVEDVALLSLSRLPMVREITFEAAERALSAEQVELHFRTQATRLRAIFEAGARRAGLRHAFRVARGEVMAELLKAAAEYDVMVLGHSRSHSAQALAQRLRLAELLRQGPATLVFVQERWPTGRRVMTWFGGRDGDRALRLAAAISRAEDLELSVLLSDESGRREELQRAAQELLGARAARFVGISRTGVRELARAAVTEDARVLLLPGAALSTGPTLVTELLKRVECSVITTR
jgi:hypothetical protein